MDVNWLKQIFSGAGKILEIYIPWKRSFQLNQRFGFVRYGSKEEGLKAIKMWNIAQIQRHRLLVKVASFNNSRWNKQGQDAGVKKVYRVVRDKNAGPEESNWTPRPKNASVLVNRRNNFAAKTGRGAQPCIDVSEVGNEWLSRSAIATLSPLRNLVITLNNKNRRYNVRVSEEQYVINTFLRIECKCKGCLSAEASPEIQNLSVNKEKVDMEEKVETNEEAEKTVGTDERSKAVGTDERSLRLINVGMHGGNYELAARDTLSSSSGIETSVRGNGMVRVSLREGVGALPISNLAPLTVIGLNRILLSPRVSLSKLVENRDNWAANSVSWVANSINENSASPSILSERNDEGENGADRLLQNLVTHTHDEPFSAPLKAAINGVKGKNNRKSIYDILGFSKVNSFNNKGRRNKQKCGAFRSAVAVVALSSSLSSEGVINRNRIILNEAQAIWECNKIMGVGYDGDEDEVVSRFVEMEAQDLDRADRVAGQL
ncbi:hypothetical protein RHMOL_Rhmol05G0021000 [Rhododendron molle]|uniref:Uncharacterized protein n=1 Tax=Rhododendron molle TaxID=49168 RepID=A0ACC0NKT3_RHOML|nr:hypothetical protein RHMOL_Rhmol05G0021000 [Rhododendron molle]